MESNITIKRRTQYNPMDDLWFVRLDASVGDKQWNVVSRLHAEAGAYAALIKRVLAETNLSEETSH